MATASEIKTLQCNNIATVLSQDTLCDVTFVIGSSETRFRANRVFLAVISDVFKAMLYGAMKEGQSNSVITIPDIDANGFEAVLAFAHCKHPQITENNVVSIKNICRKYQITSLSPVCNSRFQSLLNKHNGNTFCSLLNDSVHYKVDKYVDLCQAAMQSRLGRNAESIVKSKGFKSMGIEAMIIFLQYDVLDITEEKLWDALLKWKDHQNVGNDKRNSLEEPVMKKRKLNASSGDKALKAVCPYVRFGLMTGQYFVDKVQPQKCLDKDEVILIANYILCPDKAKRSCGKFSTQKRSFKRHVIDSDSESDVDSSMFPFTANLF